MRHSAEFATTVRRGRRVGVRALTVHVATSAAGEGHPDVRVGFVIPRTVGPAVVRNQVRRRLRHLLRERLAALPPGTRVVVRAHPAAAGVPSSRLGVDLDRALERALDPTRTRPAREGTSR
jgi:ribonuclease P protein component